MKIGWLPVDAEEYDRAAYERSVHAEWREPEPPTTKSKKSKKATKR